MNARQRRSSSSSSRLSKGSKAVDGEWLASVAIDTSYPLEDVDTAVDRLRARQVRGRNVLVP